MNVPDRDRMLTLEQAVDLLVVSTRTLRRKIETKQLSAHNFGRHWRISRIDLQDYLDRNHRSWQSDSIVL